MVRKAALLVLFLFLFVSSASSQILSATASTGKTHYLIGDYIHYKIDLTYRKGTTVYPPMIQDSLRSVSLLKTNKPVENEKNGLMNATYAFVLSGYDSAGVMVPPIPVLFRTHGDTALQSISTNPVGFTVSTVKVNLKEGIKDVKSPIKIPFNLIWLLLWLGVALVAAAIAYYFYRRYKKKKTAAASVKPVAKVLPHEAALKALHELETQRLWQRGMIKEYHSGITEIIRRYFEKRFAMPAMELPTSEAIELLEKSRETEPIRDLAYDFLSNADMVKFAKFTPMNSVNEEMMKQAYEIVHRTSPAAEVTLKEGKPDVQ